MLTRVSEKDRGRQMCAKATKRYDRVREKGREYKRPCMKRAEKYEDWLNIHKG